MVVEEAKEVKIVPIVVNRAVLPFLISEQASHEEGDISRESQSEGGGEEEEDKIAEVANESAIKPPTFIKAPHATCHGLKSEPIANVTVLLSDSEATEYFFSHD
mmetsp:Transcript_20999/g.25809  ORF Transcript_20999/g.25809 Transcript_20999/m.25809 type:complete len:104 (+) Transcript_20999:359-670(+)|eukprot:CAMPEP_0170475902 /NCGR_PEP_ID=MMETSP0123-20130129/17474_1 /TAXON_ID=182087 /ORGANISM="Favella ehrenbergii, Strain Fehren 1" /LENGTH=103 /DNA_ID=CAMNT_0010746719 /DNA_START=348 /DNA_END=659 /DNA_ORIENTATION=-